MGDLLHNPCLRVFFGMINSKLSDGVFFGLQTLYGGRMFYLYVSDFQ